MTQRKEHVATILSVLTDQWMTYANIRSKTKHLISTGMISSVIWNNIDGIQDKIEWRDEIFGNKPHQIRMYFRLKQQDIL